LNPVKWQRDSKGVYKINRSSKWLQGHRGFWEDFEIPLDKFHIPKQVFYHMDTPK